MRFSRLLPLAVTLIPAMAFAKTTFVSPAYPPAGYPPAATYGSPYSAYPGSGVAVPYAPAYPFRPSPYVGNSGAGGTYPSGAQTCVAMDNICRASAPNTVGNPCSCPGPDGRPVPGIVR